MKIALILICASTLALTACSRGAPPEKLRCNAALAQSQKFMTFRAGDLLAAHTRSSYADVPTVFGQGARPVGQRTGTLVIETSAPRGASQAQFQSASVTNLYCL